MAFLCFCIRSRRLRIWDSCSFFLAISPVHHGNVEFMSLQRTDWKVQGGQRKVGIVVFDVMYDKHLALCVKSVQMFELARKEEEICKGWSRSPF
uniref:Uncharacterized protein n=1 Tax=Arundo donax TaxID=35708 RepID=A0A0A8XRY7_ARUDO